MFRVGFVGVKIYTTEAPDVGEPPPNYEELHVTELLKADLTRLQAHDRQVFDSVFSQHNGVAANLLRNFSNLFESGLVVSHKNGVHSRFRVFEYGGLFILSDWKGVKPDEVFRPWRAEVDVAVPFFLDRVCDKQVLDLGCGSGLYGIAAAAAGASAVLAVDANPRALAAARVNSRLNKTENQLSFRESNLFDTVSGAFDVILAGLPYRPTPPTLAGKVYADGGRFGLDLISRALHQGESYVRLGGEIRVCCMSLGDSRTTLVERHAADAFSSGSDWSVKANQIGPAARFRDWWADNGEPGIAVAGWLDSLEDEGLTHFQRVCLSATRLGAKS